MVKVLMLGWEFPPRISGGLGTACYGLTKALAASEVHVTFVVPSLSGDEEQDGWSMLQASAQGVNTQEARHNEARLVETNAIHRMNEPEVYTIRVESPLQPYQRPETTTEEYTRYAERILSGDYLWSSAPESETSPNLQHDSGEGTLSGGYGKDLFADVERYGRLVSSMAQSLDFDVIHAHDWMTFPAALAIRRDSGKPLLVHVHSTEFDRAGAMGSKTIHHIEQAAIERADRVVAVSSYTRTILINRYFADPANVEVVHNGSSFERRTIPAREHPLGPNIVSFIGRITFQKGPEYFIKAAQKVLDVVPDAHFVMAGTGDSLHDMIRLTASLGLSGRVHFTGFLARERMAELLSFSRVYVMPSVSEPFGITPLEAAAAGVPVVISAQSGVAEVLPHALKVDFWDVENLSQAICSVLNYKSLSNTLRNESHKTLESITWLKASEKIKSLYHELLEFKQ